MANWTRGQARKLVDSIRVNNGGVEASDRDKTPDAVLEALASVRKQLAASTEILAQGLYSKQTRFVCELIQNAEDNQYTSARASGRDPFLSFSIDCEKIVIDSNEDGFSDENVNAICKVRTSTKKGARGYIGEKGIGFKSVFRIASKVQVQSGPFSFYFNYGGDSDDDDGMGMVTPFNGLHEELPNDVRTRITLKLKDDTEFESLVKEFMDLPDTLLLFLTTLQKLRISINGREDLLEINYKYVYQETTGKGLLVRDSNREEAKEFHFFKHEKTVEDLPLEKARKNINDAPVILEFPVDEYDDPFVEQQDVYAYLPLRKIGFPFQIQSDFITQASREDVLDSAWNKALLVGAPEVFVDAVLRFCEHSTLQYSWPKYLPTKAVVDTFWAQLRELIIGRICLMPILRPWSGGRLKLVGQLKFVAYSCRDGDGDSVFEDLADETYLSDEYSLNEVYALRTIGLQKISVNEVWERVRSDLKSPSSKMKSRQTSAERHSHCAKMILDQVNLHTKLQTVRGFEMLPLQDGSWTSIAAGDVYYHEIAGVDVLLDLGIRILTPESTSHPTRKELFDAIGVKSGDPKVVKRLIVHKYAKWNNVSLEASVSHIYFLFHQCSDTEQSIDKTMFLCDADKNPIYRTRVALGQTEMIIDDLYFDTSGAYNVKALCAGQTGSNGLLSQYNIHVIHAAYLKFKDAKSSAHCLSWKGWLQKYAGILHSPRLMDSRNHLKLSLLFKWIIEERSNSFLGVLKTYWNTYSKSMNSETVTTLSQVKLKCNAANEACLRDAFVPLPDLSTLAETLGVKDDMRFVKLLSESDEKSSESWRFLETFGAGVNADLDFFLDALRAIRNRYLAARPPQRSTVRRIHAAIEERAHFDDFIRHWEFPNEKAIHTKANITTGYYWTLPDLWEGPDFSTTHSIFANDEDFKRDDRYRRLFTSILEIPDADWSHTIEQITSEKEANDLKNHLCTETRISPLYHALWSGINNNHKWNTISESFEKESLIYVRSHENEWQSPSECVWSDYTHIPERFAIAGQHCGLKSFFMGRLNVHLPTLKSQIQELQVLCSKGLVLAKFSEINALIKDISLWKPKSDDVQVLLDKSVLPVVDEHGREILLQPNDEFAIVDRPRHGAMFIGKVATLAVPLEELRSVRSFLAALGLDNRYTSRLVNEISEVENAVKDTALSKDFRQRAYALVRCARYFNSPEAESDSHKLHHRLTHAIIYRTDEVTKTVNLKLGGRVLATQTTGGNLHLEDDDSSFRLYVPNNREHRGVCYFTQLPQQLMTHWSITDEAAVKVIGNALTAPTFALDGILQEHGIPELPGLQQSLHAEPDGGEDRTRTEGLDQVSGQTYIRVSSSSTVPITPSVSSFVASTSTVSAVTESRATTPEAQNTSLSLGRLGRSLVSPVITTEEAISEARDYLAKYKALLDWVVCTGERGDFPTNFAFQASRPMNSTTFITDPDAIFGVRSLDIMAHDMKICAAGELYAFETLQSRLQPFSRENWRSTIRHHVRLHEKYHDLDPWTGTETADIVYRDEASMLTRLLIAYGYLPYEFWLNKTPTYYLEVKTTTGPCDTKFFMSKAQVRRMKEIRLDPGEVSPDIYVILRVYNLIGNDIGMRILVDPVTLEREGKLFVEAENYTVVQRDVPNPGG